MGKDERPAGKNVKNWQIHRYRIGAMAATPHTLGELRQARLHTRSVKQEVRDNLVRKLQAGEPLFPGIIGYDDTVIPQLVNAILSRHNFILLGLRGQAKSRILRGLIDLLDEQIPVVPGCEIHDDPLAPLCAACRARDRPRGRPAMPIAWLPRAARYVEKLATPDVTIADMVGDIDPIKAAQAGLNLSDELTMHYGLLPRANRGIFAINELPDLAGKIQVGLFNILQEGDVQIKGYPIRLKLDVMLVFTANPEDYTARGKIITPLKDRIGSEIRTHYPATRGNAMAITRQEAWTERAGGAAVSRFPTTCARWSRRWRSRLARIARSTSGPASASGCRSPRSSSSCRTPSGGRWRTASRSSCRASPTSYAALPSITGKFELEYEGELRGAEQVARDLIRSAVGDGLHRHVRGPGHANGRRVVRPRRLAAAGRRHVGRRRRDAGARRAGPARTGRARRRRRGRDRAPLVASADRLRPRRSVRAEEDQPQRRTRLLRGRDPRRGARRAAKSRPIDEEFQIPGAKKKYYN